MAKREECIHSRCNYQNPVGAKSCARCKRLFRDNPVWLNVLVAVAIVFLIFWALGGQ